MNLEDKAGASDRSNAAEADDRMRVSSLIDGELDDEAIDSALDALMASESLTRFWLAAHCAGDWMRSDEVVGISDNEAALRRFCLALAKEPAIVAPKRRSIRASRSSRFWIRIGLPGASIAAALVVVAWVAAPFGHDDNGKTVERRLASSSDVSNVVIAKATPVVQSEARSDEPNALDPERLSPYLAAHRDVTPFAYRGASARPAAFNTSVPTSALATSP